MSEQHKKIEVYQSRRFEKALKKVSDSQLNIIEDEIERIIDDPELGELKKGDLAHLRGHKFKLAAQTVLLAYSWLDEKIEIYLLHIATHENFYNAMKKSRKRNLSIIKK